MNKIVITAKLNGMWKNGLIGKKRGLNVLLIDSSIAFKATLWQEEADWAEENLIYGDIVQISGECAGIWENYMGKAIEIKKPQIISVDSSTIEVRSQKKFLAANDNNMDEGLERE